MEHGYQIHLALADEIRELIKSPALVLGRGVLAGRPMSALPKAWRSLRLLLSEPDPVTGDSFEAVYEEGTPLSEAQAPSARLFYPRHVKRLHRILSGWDQTRLYRRFQEQMMSSTVADSHWIGDDGWCDSIGWDDESDSLAPDDWTVEEAEEFECLADMLERLAQFVGKAASGGQGIVWVNTPGGDSPDRI